jgi:O-antigen/teichoic acid export membrane protein
MLFPLCLGLSSLLPVLLPLLYGKAFAAAVPSAMVLVAFAAIAFGTVGTAALQAFERASVNAIVGTLGAIASIAGNVLLVPAIGIWGAVATRVAIQVAMLSVGVVYLSRRHACRFPGRDVAKILAAAVVCAACSAAVIAASDARTSMVIAVPFAACVYLLLVRTLHLVRPEDVPLLHELTGRLPASLGARASAFLSYLTRSDGAPAGERLVNAPL